jgi:hypothetical protein
MTLGELKEVIEEQVRPRIAIKNQIIHIEMKPGKKVINK